VPRISEFFGIVICMYWFDRQKHRGAHLHARYAGDEAVFDLAGNCLEGDLGPRVTGLVADWCRERRGALEEAWAAAISGQEIPWVAPLR
jgi:hypothetical protein